MPKSNAAKVEQTNIENPKSKATVTPFPVDIVDTSWMTKAQKRYFEVLKQPDNRDKKYDELSKLAGYKSFASWYKAIKDERFVQLLENMGAQIKLYEENYPAHHEVEVIKNPNEREEYLTQDIWDMRRLFKDYPKHSSPQGYIIKFTKIENVHLRQTIKRFFRNMLGNWKPLTFKSRLDNINDFFKVLHTKFPTIHSLQELDRQEHIEKVLPDIYSLTNHRSRIAIKCTRTMFQYMYANKWSDGPKTDTLFISYDIPKKKKILPKPIPLHIKVQLDDYLETTIIPLLEDGEDTPIISPTYWDLILILRYTGRRFEDMAHLIADGSAIDCLVIHSFMLIIGLQK